MSLVERVIDEGASHGLSLHRAAPRGPDRLVMEFRDGSGRVVAGQWFRDPDRAADVARRTAHVAAADSVSRMPDTGVVLQHDGADRRLLGLHALAARPGARLVAHRAERRGVVQLPEGDYAKVVVPEKLPGIVAASSTAAGSFAVPRVVDVDAERGVVTMSEVPGRTLESRLGDASLEDDEVVSDARAVGAALRTFHESPCPVADGPPHDGAAEIAVTERWLSAASDFGLLPRRACEAALVAAAARLAAGAAPFVHVHRDLHDKQLIMEAGRPIGLLDLDLTTRGEAAVDLANLAVHIELRHLQGRCGRDRADRCVAALLEGYAPTDATLSRMDAYRATTRLRLAGVYAFRDTPRAMLEELVEPLAV